MHGETLETRDHPDGEVTYLGERLHHLRPAHRIGVLYTGYGVLHGFLALLLGHPLGVLRLDRRLLLIGILDEREPVVQCLHRARHRGLELARAVQCTTHRGQGLRGAHEIVGGPVADRDTQEVEIGQFADRKFPRGIQCLLIILHRAALHQRTAYGLPAFAGIHPAHGLVNSGIGSGIVLQMQTPANIPLQTILAPPCELLVVSGFHNHQRRTFLPQQGLFVVAIHLGTEREVLWLVVEVEVFDELSVLAIDKLRRRLLERCKQARLLGGEGIGEAATVLVLVIVAQLVIRRALTAVGIGEGEVLDVVEMGFQCRLSRAVFSDVGQRDIGCSVSFLRDGTDAVAVGLGWIGLQIVVQTHIGVQGVVFGATHLLVVVKVEGDVDTPFLGEEFTQL